MNSIFIYLKKRKVLLFMFYEKVDKKHGEHLRNILKAQGKKYNKYEKNVKTFVFCIFYLVFMGFLFLFFFYR